MILHQYRDNINYRDKIVVNYQDIDFTIITQPLGLFYKLSFTYSLT